MPQESCCHHSLGWERCCSWFPGTFGHSLSFSLGVCVPWDVVHHNQGFLPHPTFQDPLSFINPYPQAAVLHNTEREGSSKEEQWRTALLRQLGSTAGSPNPQQHLSPQTWKSSPIPSLGRCRWSPDVYKPSVFPLKIKWMKEEEQQSETFPFVTAKRFLSSCRGNGNGWLSQKYISLCSDV